MADAFEGQHVMSRTKDVHAKLPASDQIADGDFFAGERQLDLTADTVLGGFSPGLERATEGCRPRAATSLRLRNPPFRISGWGSDRRREGLRSAAITSRTLEDAA
jgi:hypothetical protein